MQQHIKAAPDRPADHLSWQFLSGTALKVVAILTMLADHTANTLVRSATATARMSGLYLGHDAAFWADLAVKMNTVGRFAFPIFCFLLVEGFVHTRSRPKYAWRLLLFALISEIPFDFALCSQPLTVTSAGMRLAVEFGHQNVMFTLLFGLLALWLADAVGMGLAWLSGKVAGRRDFTAAGEWVALALTCATVPAFAWASNELDFDYHAFGVYLIGVLYVARRLPELVMRVIRDPHSRMVATQVLSCLLRLALVAIATYVYCHRLNYYLEMWCLAGVALLAFYNGKRGRGGAFMKYFFYAFYPGHLLLLGLLRGWLF